MTKKPDQDPGADTPDTDQPQAQAQPQSLEGAQGMSLFMGMLDKLVDKLAASQMSPSAMKDILMESGKITAEMARKAKWPENATHPHISVYSYPEGDVIRPKPVLTRTTWFCGIREEEDRLTPAEIDGYNAIIEPRSVRGGAWRAEIIMPKALGAKPDLFVWVPKETVDQRMVLPSLPLILHELNGGPSTEDVMSLLKQIEGLKALLIAKGTTTQELEATLQLA